VGGAIANDLLQARGINVGSSVTSGGSIRGLSRLSADQKVQLPQDVLVDDGKKGVARTLDTIQETDMIVDVGPKTRRMFKEFVAQYAFVVLNGPIGWYEKGYDAGTRRLLRVLADSKAKVIVGGGDTVALVSKMRLGKTFYFTSTGGGAMLDYLADGKLPGIQALIRSSKKKVRK
jgi:phosphoglycerate kinase